MFKTTGVLMVLLFGASIVHAADAGKNDAFWTALLNKLQKVTPARKSATTTAVGGVRSAKNEEAADIYWKGKEKNHEAGEEEVAAFSRALESRNSGDRLAALKHFEKFVQDYPESSLKPEAVQAVDLLKAEEAAQPPAQAAK